MNYASRINLFPKVRVLVAGDAMCDAYHFGRVDRISPEAPVPIFLEDYDRQEVRRGGADNVAHQLEVWGCEVQTLFPRRRSVKHRYFAGHHQVFRRDSDSTEQGVFELLPVVDVVILSDYGKGFLTANFCQSLIAAATKLEVPVIVDPKGSDWRKYQGAYAVCPNLSEYRALQLGVPPRIVLKKGEEGIDVIDGRLRISIPAQTRQVFDVTGAGDTVVATIAATLGCGGTLMEGAHIAVCAAGVVVGKVGTSVCTKEELLCALDLPMGSSTDFMKGISFSSSSVSSTATTWLSPSTVIYPSGDSKAEEDPSTLGKTA
jgi:bifunctional ADP-heptose synthase (sugar kinase/adenylyltransferase)